MQAIILGAGRGQRMQAGSEGLPKVFLAPAGEPLLTRQVRLLKASFPALDAITVVVGFRADRVRELGGPELRYVENADFAATNTAASLFLALRHDQQDAVLLNGDVFFDGVALSRMSQALDGALCEFKPEVDPEEVQVILNDQGQVKRIGKDIGGVAEAVGIYRLSTALIEHYLSCYTMDDRSRYYEDVFNRLIEEATPPLEAVALADGLAMEIDTPQDLLRVQSLVAVRLAA
jgi:choline kinase